MNRCAEVAFSARQNGEKTSANT